MTDFESPPFSESDPLEKTIKEVAEMNACPDSLNRVCANVLQSIGQSSLAQHSSAIRLVRLPAIATIVTLSAAILIAVFIQNRSSGQNVTFSQVQEKVEQTKTVRYVEYMSEADARRSLETTKSVLEKIDDDVAMYLQMMKDRPEELKMLLKVRNIEGDPASWLEKRASAARERTEARIKLLENCLRSGTPIPRRRVWIEGKFLQRVESDLHGQNQIELTNAKTGEAIILYPDTKSGLKIKSQMVMEMETGKTHAKDVEPLANADFYARITSLPAEDLKPLPEKKIDGVSVIGFEQTVSDGSHNIVRTYWINKITRLPVRLEATLLANGEAIGGGYCADFVFDEVFDPELFNMTPPSGYTLREGGSISLDPSK